jgi:hypothetical protein
LVQQLLPEQLCAALVSLGFLAAVESQQAAPQHVGHRGQSGQHSGQQSCCAVVVPLGWTRMGLSGAAVCCVRLVRGCPAKLRPTASRSTAAAGRYAEDKKRVNMESSK